MTTSRSTAVWPAPARGRGLTTQRGDCFFASRGLAVAALFGLLAMGCGPEFERLDFIFRTTPPPGVTADYSGITLPAGVAVGVIVVPLDDSNDEMDKETEVVLRSANPAVIGIDPALEERSFVIYGAGAGSAGITVEVDRDYHGKIPATVVLPQ